MPSSALLQLVARGRQDAYLTSNPQFTFFKHVYRRYTPFAKESIPIDFDGYTNFGQRVTTTIPRHADLLSSLFIEVDLPGQPDPTNPTYWWVNDIGNALINDISVEIGEKEIDKHTGEWLNIWGELTVPASQREGYNEMIGHWNIYPPFPSQTATPPLHLTIPLRFWFCNTIGAALPLIALQAHPVRIIIHIRPLQDLVWIPGLVPGGVCPSVTPVTIPRFQMFGDYIYLDTEERRRFASAEHEYLIDQLQISPSQTVVTGTSSISMPLYFNHCCKEFIWVIQQNRMTALKEWFNYSSCEFANGGQPGCLTQDLLGTAILRLDGSDRFYVRNAPYFRLTQPYQHHTTVPTPPTYIYLYSFSLRPEEIQPSGSLNCSKIDDIVLSLTFNPNTIGAAVDDGLGSSVRVYATNYNVLRIIGGLGGLAFIA
jgi:hypothetical protein